MTFVDQMAQLADKIVDARAQRAEELATIHPENMKKMEKDHHDREAAMTELNQSIKDDMVHINEEVKAIHDNTEELLHHYHEELLQKKKECAESLKISKEALKKQVSSQLDDCKADRKRASSVWRQKTQATLKKASAAPVETKKAGDDQ